MNFTMPQSRQMRQTFPCAMVTRFRKHRVSLSVVLLAVRQHWLGFLQKPAEIGIWGECRLLMEQHGVSKWRGKGRN